MLPAGCWGRGLHRPRPLRKEKELLFMGTGARSTFWSLLSTITGWHALSLNI